MTWDAKDGYLLLVGGRGCGVWNVNHCNDTWSFLGGNWTYRAAGPVVGYFWATLAYDQPLSKAVLFTGGYGLSHTFSWSAVHGWVAFGPNPAPSWGAWGDGEMVYDPGLRSLVVASAFNLSCPGVNSQYCLHTWSYSGGTWTPLANKTTDYPLAFGMAWDPNNHRVVLYPRGQPSFMFAPPLTQQFIGTHWINVTGFSPASRYGPAIAYDGADGYLLMFGGSPSGTNNAPTSSWELL
jgi:hypothetical protein